MKVVGNEDMLQEETLFWQTRIQITQAPEKFEPEEIPENAVPFYQTPGDIRTFLNDPLGKKPSCIYGLKITATDKVDVIFFTKAESESEAIQLGHAWLSNLKYKFMGLDGIVKARPIIRGSPELLEQSQFLEIILPIGFITGKINILERFINAFYYKNDHEVELFLMWRREPRSKQLEEQSNLFNLRIFVRYDSKNIDLEDELELKGIIQFLSMDIENQKGDRAQVTAPSEISNLDLLEGNVFKDDDDHDQSANIVQEDVNFDFPENLPLPRIPRLVLARNLGKRRSG